MTGREIERIEKSLPRWENGKPPVRTAEETRLAEELSCRGMINSILIYHGVDNVRKGTYFYNQYLSEYTWKLGEDTVARLCDEQVQDFKKAAVSFAGYCDGISYNSIMWADEIADAVVSLIENDLAQIIFELKRIL